MKVRPILYSGPMVRAILDDLKTQTRRTSKLYFINDSPDDWEFLSFADGKFHFNNKVASRLFSVTCPYGQAGDRLWVRETFAPHDGCFIYRASWELDCPDVSLDGLWKPSIHMPRAASRINLEVVSIRVERLRDISEQDARAEGAEPVRYHDGKGGYADHTSGAYRKGFERLWVSINDFGSWLENPWVWVVEFKRLEAGA